MTPVAADVKRWKGARGSKNPPPHVGGYYLHLDIRVVSRPLMETKKAALAGGFVKRTKPILLAAADQQEAAETENAESDGRRLRNTNQVH